MPERPKPYITHARPARWSGLTLAAFLVLWVFYYLGDKNTSWERPLFFVFAVIFFVGGTDAVRTGEAMFDWGVWIHWTAERRDQPVRFWMLTLMNFALGAWGIGLSLFAEKL